MQTWCKKLMHLDDKVDVIIISLKPLNDGIKSMVERVIPVNRIIENTEKYRGVARMNAIRKVETEYFVFLDDDIFLHKGWFQEISKYRIFEKSAWIEGWSLPTWPRWYSRWVLDRYNHASNIQEIKVSNNSCATLIETFYVKDWVARDKLDWGEGYEISRHIMKKGGKLFQVKTKSIHEIKYDFWPHTKEAIQTYKQMIPLRQRIPICFRTIGSGARTHSITISLNAVRLGLLWI